MYFPNSLVVLAALVASTQAFMSYTPVLTNTPKSSSSSSSSILSMVADDAKVCLVTGSSRGLGKAIALDLGKAGQKVIINFVSDSSKDGAEATVAEIKALGGDAVAIQADSK
jgi:3-oxoacyl-[acyl-carrier protein] reductase